MLGKTGNLRELLAVNGPRFGQDVGDAAIGERLAVVGADFTLNFYGEVAGGGDGATGEVEDEQAIAGRGRGQRFGLIVYDLEGAVDDVIALGMRIERLLGLREPVLL